MKTSIFLLPALLLSTVSAAPWSTNKFSRKSMETWRKSLPKDSKLNKAYQAGIKNLIDDGDVRREGCPKSLSEKDILLSIASGVHKKKNKEGKWEETITKSTGDLNEIKFIYNIDGGRCGQIKVSTKAHTSRLMSWVDRYKWQDPIWSMQQESLFESQTHKEQSIRNDEIKISAGTAFDKGQKASNALKMGFTDVTLTKTFDGERTRLVYRFSGLKGVGNHLREVYVSATDGRVREEGDETFVSNL